MREPAFWWHPAGWQSALLSPLATIYGAITAARMARPGYASGVPVICIGNLTVGGAGKTPTALAIAQWLVEAGRQPFLLSRGYGGALAGPLQVDPTRHMAEEVGDEPLLLARAAPTIVARDRKAGAIAAFKGGAGVIVMDDGFQNPAVAKDLSIVVIDGRRGIGNGQVFPAGPLRAPVAKQLEHADALLLIGQGRSGDAAAAIASKRGLPLFHGRLEPDAAILAALRERPVLAFAGIGDPEKFFATLRDGELDVRAARAFPDHHQYQPGELLDLAGEAARLGLSLVTTEKDFVRLVGRAELAPLAPVRALPVTLAMTEERSLRELVLARIR
jgi:tetraacyldisaccharide 4'-kinase